MDAEKLRRFERNIIVYDVVHYLSKLDTKGDMALLQRQDETLTADGLLQYFKSRERLHNIRMLLQYMIDFLERPPYADDPLPEEGRERLSQFRLFVCFQADLMLEDDVRRRIRASGLTPAGDESDAAGEPATRLHREVTATVADDASPIRAQYCALFAALRRLSLFWFEVQDLNPEKLRKSDVYIYMLANMLLADAGMSGSAGPG